MAAAVQFLNNANQGFNTIAPLPPSSKFTACGFVRVDEDLSGGGPLCPLWMTSSAASTGSGIQAYLSTSSGTVTVTFGDDNSYAQVNGALTVLYQTWFFWALQNDGSTVRFFWGHPLASALNQLSFATTVGSFTVASLWHGADNTGDNSGFSSAGVRYWSGAQGILNTAELTREAASIAPNRLRGLWDWWPFAGGVADLRGRAANSLWGLFGSTAGQQTVAGPSVPFWPRKPFRPRLANSGGAGASVLPGGWIDSDAIVGALSATISVAPAGCDTQSQLGADVVARAILLSGSDSREAFGADLVAWGILPGGLDTREASGAMATAPGVLPGGLDSREAFGANVPGPRVLPSGVSTLESPGAIAATAVLPIQPAGTETLERFGASYFTVGVLPSGSPTLEFLGANASASTLYPAGTSTQEVQGATVATAITLVQPSGSPTEERFGAPTAGSRVLPGGLESQDRSGAHVSGPYVYSAGAVTVETFGALTQGSIVVITIQPSGTDTGETFGAHRTIGIVGSMVRSVSNQVTVYSVSQQIVVTTTSIQIKP